MEDALDISYDEPTGVSASFIPELPDFEVEFEKMKTTLQAAGSKIIGEWLGTDLQTAVQNGENSYQNRLQQYSDSTKNLESDLRKIRSDKENHAKGHERQVEELVAQKAVLHRLRQDTDRQLQEREHLQTHLQRADAQLLEQQKLLEDRQYSTDRTTKELDKSLVLFIKHLGLNMKKISGGRLQLVFTCIDEHDLTRPFCFCVRINEDRSYTVSNCEPPVPDFDKLAAKLQTTNNFRSFVIEMRRRFKALVS